MECALRWLWGVNKTFFFWVRPVVFLNQTFIDLTQSFSFYWFRPSVSVLLFVEAERPYFDSVLPICWVSPCLFWVQLSMFWLSPSRSLESDLLYLNQSFPSIESVLLIFFAAFFPLFPVLCFDLITISTVDRTKDEGRCMKLLLQCHERKIEILLREKMIPKILRNKQKQEKNKVKQNCF